MGISQLEELLVRQYEHITELGMVGETLVLIGEYMSRGYQENDLNVIKAVSKSARCMLIGSTRGDLNLQEYGLRERSFSEEQLSFLYHYSGQGAERGEWALGERKTNLVSHLYADRSLFAYHLAKNGEEETWLKRTCINAEKAKEPEEFMHPIYEIRRNEILGDASKRLAELVEDKQGQRDWLERAVSCYDVILELSAEHEPGSQLEAFTYTIRGDVNDKLAKLTDNFMERLNYLKAGCNDHLVGMIKMRNYDPQHAAISAVNAGRLALEVFEMVKDVDYLEKAREAYGYFCNYFQENRNNKHYALYCKVKFILEHHPFTDWGTGRRKDKVKEVVKKKPKQRKKKSGWKGRKFDWRRELSTE